MKNQKIIVIDNYDSFTYNLVHIIEELVGYEITVKRNDNVTLRELEGYDTIFLSPGPGIPEEAGLLKTIIKEMGPKKKIFGVCLGLQAIGEVYGSQLTNLDKVFHGISTTMKQTDEKCPIFAGINNEFPAGRYHSWVINKDTLAEELTITAIDEYGEIMGIHHKEFPIYAVQFHPESIMTPDGKKMIKNFLNL